MPNQVNLSLQIIPLNTTNAYPLVDAAIHAIQASGIRHEVQPFATVMEGPLPTLLAIVHKAQEAAMQAGAEELLVNIQIHLKKGEDVYFEDKTASFQ